MINVDVFKKEIVSRLKPLDLDKIILFGSYAYGTPKEDRDKKRGLTPFFSTFFSIEIYNYTLQNHVSLSKCEHVWHKQLRNHLKSLNPTEFWSHRVCPVFCFFV